MRKPGQSADPFDPTGSFTSRVRSLTYPGAKNPFADSRVRLRTSGDLFCLPVQTHKLGPIKISHSGYNDPTYAPKKVTVHFKAPDSILALYTLFWLIFYSSDCGEPTLTVTLNETSSSVANLNFLDMVSDVSPSQRGSEYEDRKLAFYNTFLALLEASLARSPQQAQRCSVAFPYESPEASND